MTTVRERTADPATAEDAAGSIRGSRPRVLVVDDGAQNRELLRTLLESEVDVVEAPNGTTALALAVDPAVDLVLLDVMMPDLSGYEVCRRLRELRPDEYLPILLLTSLTEEPERVKGFDAGADDFISKPISTVELRLRVRAFLRARRLHLERQALLDDLQVLHDLKDDLAALLVHDLRNPLAGLMAHLSLLDSGELSEEARESVDASRVATSRLREMIDDLLQVRLLEDSAFQIAAVPTDVGAVVHAAVQTMEGAARKRSVQIQVEDAGRERMDCDATLVRRAMENLLANAIRHSPEGATIAVRINGSPNEILIAVDDRGAGIPEAQRPLLFTKYGTMELRRGGRRSGHGLGLYLVSLVMRAHFGSVHVDGAARVGTSVVMVFRRSLPPA